MKEKIKQIIGLIVVIFIGSSFLSGAYDWFTKPHPVSTETVTKPAPPKVERPEKSFYAESYDALRQVTGQRVTETWMLEFNEYIDRQGNVDTNGFVEFNDDGVKRQFWLMFDNTTRQCLRVKVDSQLLYTAVGW